MKGPGHIAVLVPAFFNISVIPVIYLLLCLAVAAAWSPPGFAVQTIAGSGNLNAQGEQEGVAMTAGPGTLTVGTQDIFTDNAAALLPGTAVSTDASASHSIVFNGSSTVHGDVGAAGLLFDVIDINAGAITVVFRGTVFTTTMDVATTSVSFNSGTSTNVGAVNFTDDGTVTLGLNTILTGALTTNTANTGTLVLSSGSRWDGAVGGATGLRAIGVSGNAVSAGITGAVDVNSLNLGNNTLNITGNLRIRNPGPNSINTTLTSDTVYGNVVATGGATSFPATLGVNVLVPSTTLLTPGTQFNIINSQAGPGTSVVSVSVQNPTNPLYTFSATPTLGGDVTITLTGVPLTAVADPLVVPIADVVLGGPLTPDLTQSVAAVNALNTPAAVVNAVAQLAPTTASLAAPQVVAFQRARMFQNLWLSRLDVCRGDNRYDEVNNPQTCRDDNDPRSGWWAKGIAYAGEQDAIQGSTRGYDSRVFGGLIAYDMPFGPDTRAGLGVGYARSKIDGMSFNSETESDSWLATVYAGHEFGPWFVHGSASAAWDDYSGQRNIQFPGVNRTASADYSGNSYSAYAKLGHHFIAARDVRITPSVSLHYNHVKLDDYTETGAGDLNLGVDSESYNFAESGVGVQVERDHSFRGGLAVTEMHVNWFHRLSNPTPKTTARFVAAGSNSFTTRGHDADDNTYNVGAGLKILSCSVCDATSWSFDLVYDYEWRNDDYSSHQGMLRLSARF